MRSYIDSDILIWHLRGEEKAYRFLKKLQADETNELWTGAMQRAEVIFIMKPQEEKDTLLFLSRFKTAAADQRIVDEAAALYREWNPSHGIDVNDAMLAATVSLSGGVLYTLNTRHYPMPGILVKPAWK